MQLSCPVAASPGSTGSNNMKIDPEKCNGCGLCVKDCPLCIVRLENKKAVIGEGCVACQTCFKVCPRQAVTDLQTLVPGSMICGKCPVACQIPEGQTGACRRFQNQQGDLLRTRPLLTYQDVAASLAPAAGLEIRQPIITAIGAGGTYPDYVPAPYIVTDRRNGVDVGSHPRHRGPGGIHHAYRRL